jgi:hypothetical protein
MSCTTLHMWIRQVPRCRRALISSEFLPVAFRGLVKGDGAEGKSQDGFLGLSHPSLPIIAPRLAYLAVSAGRANPEK